MKCSVSMFRLCLVLLSHVTLFVLNSVYIGMPADANLLYFNEVTLSIFVFAPVTGGAQCLHCDFGFFCTELSSGL